MSTEPPVGRAPQRRRSLLGIFLALGLMGFLGLAALVALGSLLGGIEGGAKRLGNDRVAVITVAGMIMSSAEPSVLGGAGGAGAAQLIDDIRDAADDDSVKAVLLRLDSPGGAAAASQEVYECIMAAREESRKPFVASMADIAASGAYYIAAACEKIVANRATLTGSIGVVMPAYDMSGLLQWIRVKPETIKSGKFKDIGSPDRSMSAAERQLLQQLVDNTYQQFLGDVARGRRVKTAAVAPYADGRIFTGEQARKVGLVDELGGFYHAVDVARKLAKLPTDEEPNLYFYGHGSLLQQLLEARSFGPSRAGWSLGLDPSRLPPLWFLCPQGAPQLRLGAGS